MVFLLVRTGKLYPCFETLIDEITKNTYIFVDYFDYQNSVYKVDRSLHILYFYISFSHKKKC